MNKFAKTFLGILIVVIPVIILLGLLFNSLSQKSFYPYTGQIPVKGLKQQVKVYFDDFGVPHVIGKNREDIYFSQGYLHARDRIWQMDLTRRVAEGRLSEIFGSQVIEFDKLFRTIGIHRFCYSWIDSLSPESKSILESYTAGVNIFIEENYNNLPVEFDALNYRPEPWKMEHSLMLARMMAWDLNISWYTDYIMGQVLNKTGIEKTASIFPDTNIVIYTKPAEEIQDSTEAEEEEETKPKKRKRTETGLKENENGNYLKQVSSLGKDFFETERNYRKFFNTDVSHTGSNSWVISGNRSMNGKPILCNDPHLALQAPSRWYEIQLTGGELDVRGMSFPGIPGIVIGNNRFISWGLTNLMNDDNDFIILQRDSADSKKYIYGNQSVFLDSIKEKIYIKDSAETSYTVYTTKIGPVISGLTVKGFADLNENKRDIYKDKLMTFRWTGFEKSDEVKCFYGINKSKNWNEFKESLKDFCAPAQNFIFADINGNIGYRTGGKIPVRKTNKDFSYIFPGENELDWAGFIDFEQMPEVYNPPEGFIVTANTDPNDLLKENKKNFYISYLWEPSSRFKMIRKFLNSKSVFDSDDFKLLQNSYESPYALELLKNIFSDTLLIKYDLNTDSGKLTDILKNWNGDMQKNNSAGTIYNTFLVFLIKNSFMDEMGEEVFDDFISIQNLPYRSLERIANNPVNEWFDNVNTSQNETRTDIVRLSISQTGEFLKNKTGNNDPNSWLWGLNHYVKFTHPLGFVKELDKTFNIGPYEIGGDQTSVNNTEYRFSDVISSGKFQTVVGASMRMIVDFNDIEHSYTINSTGQSGQPVSTHYNDQARMWSFGEYKRNKMSETGFIGGIYNLMILNP